MIEVDRVTAAWSTQAGRDCVDLHGWPRAELDALAELSTTALSERFAIMPASLASATGGRVLQPIAGRFEVAPSAGALRFIPRFPFADGLEYALLERSPSATYRTVATLRRPARAAHATTEVLAIYPTAAMVPVNLLKMYVYFSAPMSEGWAARAVRVRRADTGEPLEDVFVPGGLELWDVERSRLTLLLDPGRIKRGLVPHQQMGYPLIEGVPIVFSVDTGFHDAFGEPLRAAVERRYEVGEAWRKRLDPSVWRCQAPAAGSLDPVTVSFDRSLDQGLLGHSLTVCDERGAPLPGRASGGPGERTWRFQPEAPWQLASYFIRIAPRLEDLAGNSVTRVFDRDLTIAQDTPRNRSPIAITFTCRGSS